MGNNISKNECNYIDIARVIGIYLVILDHFPLNDSFLLSKAMIASFHMPLFFLISGLLHQNNYKLKTTVFFIITTKSLLLSYLMYNILFVIIYAPFKTISASEIVYNFINGQSFNGPTWFFLVLFYIKILSWILRKNISYIIVGFLCILALYKLKQSPNTLMLKTALSAFPYYAIGVLLQSKLQLFYPENKKTFIMWFKIIFVVASFTLIYVVAYKYGYMNIMALGYNKRLILSFFVGTIASIGILYLSTLLYPIFKSTFILTISRGTMLIVGTHWLMTYLFRLYYPELHMGYSAIIAFIILICYYYPINASYKRYPFLYGKYKMNR